MRLLTPAQQEFLYELRNAAGKGMRMHQLGSGGGGKTKLRKGMKDYPFVELFVGPDATTWMRITGVGHEFLEALNHGNES